MDGEIWVESAVNEGSQFMFTVKTRINRDISSLMLHDRMKPFIGRTILCVGHGVAPQDLRTIKGLGMVPAVFKYVEEVNDKSVVPNVEAIIVDSIEAVSSFHLISMHNLDFLTVLRSTGEEVAGIGSLALRSYRAHDSGMCLSLGQGAGLLTSLAQNLMPVLPRAPQLLCYS